MIMTSFEEKALKRGKREGKKEGKENERRKIITTMYNEGMPVTDIAKYTRIPEKDILMIVGLEN